jgi:succinyl-diaminopimelate desuccinylase
LRTHAAGARGVRVGHNRPVDPAALRDELLAEARARGFSSAGVASVRPFRRIRERALRAIAEGRMAEMRWYSPERVEAATDLGGRHPWARSLLALAWPYAPGAPPGSPAPPVPAASGRPRGRMAAYACLATARGGTVDYHDHLAAACDGLVDWLRERAGEVRAKRFVDHGWAIDRAVAERAGIGFPGKNACLITREAGSYVLLAEVLLSLPLPPTSPSQRGCGSCRACLPACPTGAITAPGVVDSRRCISYLTIEHRGAIAEELRPLLGTWAFGCDLCQEACPVNSRLAPAALAAGAPGTASGPVPHPDLVECLELDDEEFRRRFRRTAVWRTGRAGLARNAAIALGNAGDPGALGALRRAASTDPDPVVRDAAAWAINRLTDRRTAPVDAGTAPAVCTIGHMNGADGGTAGAGAPAGLDRRLAGRTLELVDIPSVSGDERAILDHVSGVLAGVEGQLHADADGLLLLLPRRGRPLVLLAGHLDTVPTQGNLPGRREGDAIVGLGASDMKGACAVMIELALWAAAERPRLAVDLGFLFFGREELPADRSALRPLLARLPVLGEADLAVVMEPTDNALQVGCLGNLTAEVRFTGRSAHSARPWFGVNAVHAAVAGLAGVAALPPQPVVIQGLEFREVVSVVRIQAGIADNVVPDVATCRLNYRYAPGRDPAAAEARLRELVPGGELSVVGNSPPAPVVADHPLCARLRAAGGLDLQPKQAWTNVADFAEHGVAAVNFGPGSTAHAHRADERVEVESLVRSFETLRRFVCEGTPEASR